MFVVNLLDFINEREEGQYSDFLVSKGYQSSNFTNFHKGEFSEDVMFTKFIEFRSLFLNEKNIILSL